MRVAREGFSHSLDLYFACCLTCCDAYTAEAETDCKCRHRCKNINSMGTLREVLAVHIRADLKDLHRAVT